MGDHLSWRTTSFGQVLYFNVNEPVIKKRRNVLRDHIFIGSGVVFQGGFYCNFEGYVHSYVLDTSLKNNTILAWNCFQGIFTFEIFQFEIIIVYFQWFINRVFSRPCYFVICQLSCCIVCNVWCFSECHLKLPIVTKLKISCVQFELDQLMCAYVTLVENQMFFVTYVMWWFQFVIKCRHSWLLFALFRCSFYSHEACKWILLQVFSHICSSGRGGCSRGPSILIKTTDGTMALCRRWPQSKGSTIHKLYTLRPT